MPARNASQPGGGGGGVACVPPLPGVSGAPARCPEARPECEGVPFSLPGVKAARGPPAARRGRRLHQPAPLPGGLRSRPEPLGLGLSPSSTPLGERSFSFQALPGGERSARGRTSSPAVKLLISVFVFIGRTIAVMGAGRAL